MKISVPVTFKDQIDDHFGHCEYFKIFTIAEDNKISDIQTMDSLQGCGCKSNIASVLAGKGVSVMLAGGIGAGAINVLNSQGIEVLRGCTGNATDAVNLFIGGKLIDSGSSCTQHDKHHGQGDQHNCNH
jgi:predicted Fe-Mo cluster-binding NifX family protein